MIFNRAWTRAEFNICWNWNFQLNITRLLLTDYFTYFPPLPTMKTLNDFVVKYDFHMEIWNVVCRVFCCACWLGANTTSSKTLWCAKNGGLKFLSHSFHVASACKRIFSSLFQNFSQTTKKKIITPIFMKKVEMEILSLQSRSLLSPSLCMWWGLKNFHRC